MTILTAMIAAIEPPQHFPTSYMSNWPEFYTICISGIHEGSKLWIKTTCEIDFRWDWTMVWFILILLLSQPFHCHPFICFQIITNFPFAFLHVCSLFLISTVIQPSPLYFSIVNSVVRITDEYIEKIQQSSRKTVQGVIVLPCMNSPWPSTLIEFSNKTSATSHEKIEECNLA